MKPKEKSLDWAIQHLKSYYDSDFFPKLFEFTAIDHSWEKVKSRVLGKNFEEYTPRSPKIYLAPKGNDNFRVVHQLAPIDSIIYTAFVYEIAEKVEKFRIPPSEKIVFSYRISPSVDGSFFEQKNDWNDFTERAKNLAEFNKKGYVIEADIKDFYNQIYLHRIGNLISEASSGTLDKHSKVIEDFLMNLNKNTSRGIPVGPAASIILAELIMADIDNKILNFTRSFVRYVDDIKIFLDTKKEAINLLRELTEYIYSNHRLVFNNSKTRVVSVENYLQEYHFNKKEEVQDAKERVAMQKAEQRLEEVIQENDIGNPYGPWSSRPIPDTSELIEEIKENEEFEIIKDSYKELLKDLLNEEPPNFSMIRHVIKNARRYRVRNILDIILNNFSTFVPVIREVVVYLDSVLSQEVVSRNKEKFLRLWDNEYVELPFVNHWLSYLFQNEEFNELLETKIPYSSISEKRDKAMHAIQKRDTQWVRNYRDGADLLGMWERRGVLFSSQILPYDEMRNWINSVTSTGDIVDEAISDYLASEAK